jgi:hypothetical protein
MTKSEDKLLFLNYPFVVRKDHNHMLRNHELANHKLTNHELANHEETKGKLLEHCIFCKAVSWVGDRIDDAAALAKKAAEAAAEAARKLVDTLKSVLNAVPEIVRKLLESIIEPIKGFFTKAFDLSFIKDKILEIGNQLKSSFMNMATNIFNMIKSMIDKVIRTLKDTFDFIVKQIIKLFEMIKSAIKRLLDLIIQFGKTLLDKIKTTFSNIFKQFKIIIGNMINFFMSLKDRLVDGFMKFINIIVKLANTVKEGGSYFINKILKPLLLEIFGYVLDGFAKLSKFIKSSYLENKGFIKCAPVYLYPFVPLMPFSFISIFVELYSRSNSQCLSPKIKELRQSIILSMKNPFFTICVILGIHFLTLIMLKKILDVEESIPTIVSLGLSFFMYMSWLLSNSANIPSYIKTFDKYYPKPPVGKQSVISIQIIWFMILLIGSKLIFNYLMDKVLSKLNDA